MKPATNGIGCQIDPAHMNSGGMIEAKIPLLDPDETFHWGFLCYMREETAGQAGHLPIKCQPCGRLKKGAKPDQFFMAGSDERAARGGLSRAASFFAPSYTAEEYEDLKRQLCSIDLTETI
jgi:hypothetical protein